MDDIRGLKNKKGKFDITKLTDSQKYNLKHHITPPPNFRFPLNMFKKQSKKVISFYSQRIICLLRKEYSIWCVSFAVFADISKQKLCESFVNTGFKNWQKLVIKQRLLVANKYQQSNIIMASLLIENFEKPKKKASSLLNQELQDRAQTYRKIVV